MPEPQEHGGTKSEKSSKILEFFNKKVKETKKEQPFTRIVIRRLPPRLTKEELLNQIVLPSHDSLNFVRGDLSLGQQSFSRAYVNFLNPEEIFGFKEKYDDLPFLDDQGREYHAVVEWAPVQRLRKKGSQQKLTSSGTLETDPKYIEFLERLEKEKTNAGNPSEYFMETDNIPLKEAKVTTTPLLEFLKLKRQQKIDLRNEHKIRKKEAEKERRRKEDEARRVEKVKRAKEKEKKKLDVDEKSTKVEETKVERDKGSSSKEKDESKNPNSDGRERKFDSKSPRPIKIEKPDFKSSIRREDRHDKNTRGFDKAESSVKPSRSFEKTNDGVSTKQKKESIEERKNNKSNQPERKIFSSSKIDDSSIKPFVTKPSDDKRKNLEPEKKEETKSKFRYSEQRNRDRGVRKTVSKSDIDKPDPPATIAEGQKEVQDAGEMGPRIRRQSTQETSDGSVDGDEIKPSTGKKTSGRKDPRTERRIRNKDRPSIEIYRPGMGKFSKQRLEQKKDDSDSIDTKKDEKTDSEYKKSDGKSRKERRKDDNRNERNFKAEDVDSNEAGSTKEKSDDSLEGVSKENVEISAMMEENNEDLVAGESSSKELAHDIEQDDNLGSAADAEASKIKNELLGSTETGFDLSKTENKDVSHCSIIDNTEANNDTENSELHALANVNKAIENTVHDSNKIEETIDKADDSKVVPVVNDANDMETDEKNS